MFRYPCVEVVDDLSEFLLGRSYASQVGHYAETHLVFHSLANRGRQVSSAAACTVRDGDEIRIAGGDSLGGSNEWFDGFLRLRRKEFD